MSAFSSIVFLSIALLITSCGSQPQANSNTGPSSPTAASGSPCQTPGDPNLKLLINNPCDGARVAQRSFVGGTVADASAQVWVVIHPMETADYWVQPAVTIRDAGRWKVLCYFGEPGAQHSGKPYEVQAFMNPKERLSQGQLLSSWPLADAKSQTIELVRE
jgi:hypothetical protein